MIEMSDVLRVVADAQDIGPPKHSKLGAIHRRIARGMARDMARVQETRRLRKDYYRPTGPDKMTSEELVKMHDAKTMPAHLSVETEYKGPLAEPPTSEAEFVASNKDEERKARERERSRRRRAEAKAAKEAQ